MLPKEERVNEEAVIRKVNYLLKYISLATLVAQTTTLVLVLRYSRTVPITGSRYLSSVAIVISEIIKLLTAVVFLFVQSQYSLKALSDALYLEVFKKAKETLKLVIPAALYTIQNNLLFMALSNLDAATYQVTYQLKILTTALFSVTMLRKQLAYNQWFSLILLTFGVALVQWPSENSHDSDAKKAKENASYLVGLAAVLAACVSSGFTGVYFQKIVQSSGQSLWIRTIQLGLFSLIFCGAAVVMQDLKSISDNGIFQGFNKLTWLVIFLQAFGGICVATVMKYADNILKGFATSVSVVLSTLISYNLSDIELTRFFILGAIIVIIATIIYSVKLSPKAELISVNSNRKSNGKL